jgi:hypothetical protein
MIPRLNSARAPSDAVEETVDGLSTTYAESLMTLMTLNLKRFKDVSLHS